MSQLVNGGQDGTVCDLGNTVILTNVGLYFKYEIEYDS